MTMTITEMCSCIDILAHPNRKG